MSLCIIPARGGSKRIPGKNVRLFAGRPMIAWSISAALESGIFRHVVVSSDDAVILDIARQEGAETPFSRPADLADDHTPTVPVIRHAIEACEALWGPQEVACCLYATAPFVQADDLRAGRALLERTFCEDGDVSGNGFVLPVTSFPFPIQRAVRLRQTGLVEMFQPEHALTRSQDLEEAWHDVGQFYWGTRSAWFDDLPLMGPRSVALRIPRHRAQDIDTPEDWVRAEALFAALQGV